jgi:hypothetical protein
MNKLVAMIVVLACISPAMAQRPKLRGPSSPKPTRLYRSGVRHHCHNRHSRTHTRNRRRIGHAHRQPQRTVVIMHTYRQQAPKPRSIASVRPQRKSQHRIIMVVPRPRNMPRMRTRNQIIRECKEKARKNVYKNVERKQ